ncbi:MAG: putative peptidase oligoendopeptidase-related clade 3 [Micavibrio sp.]|nr:putative peptidase oligoendopeptidase-related clade 3 [Micavibrio sp.]
MLSKKADKYTLSAAGAALAAPGLYYPDSVVDAVIAEAEKIAPGLYQSHLARPGEFAFLQNPALPKGDKRFTIPESRQLIINAFSDFDPELGRRAQAIFENPARWNLQEVAPGECRMMRSRPAESPANQYNPANPLPHSVIDYDFDGTIDGVIWMAHEIGHSIADDCAREAGGSFRNTPEHLNEFQAYLPQQIACDALINNPDPQVAEAAKRHYSALMTENIYNLPLGLNAKAMQNALDAGQPPGSEIIHQWFGKDWDKHPRADEIMKTLHSGDPSAREQRDAQIESLHCRPIGTLVSAGLYNHLKDQDQATRNRTLNTLFRPFDPNGSKGISEILATAGVEYSFQMGELARSTIQNVADSLQKPQLQTEDNPLAGLSSGP